MIVWEEYIFGIATIKEVCGNTWILKANYQKI
jgi:hypothetical protein